MLGTEISGGRPAPSFELDRCTDVSVCDLPEAERFLAWAIRWQCSDQDDPDFAEECLRDSFHRAGWQGALFHLGQFVCSICPQRLSCPAANRLGCWRLNPLEARALHAVACLQDGLIGEAWETLRAVCPEPALRSALESLQALGIALGRSGVTIGRWRTGATQAAGHSSH